MLKAGKHKSIVLTPYITVTKGYGYIHSYTKNLSLRSVVLITHRKENFTIRAVDALYPP